MSDLDDVVSVEVAVTSSAPVAEVFDTPLLFVHHAIGTGGPKAVEYSDLDEVVTAGHAVGSAAYQMALVAFSQSPRPGKVIIGRRSTATSQVIHFTPTLIVAATVYKFRITIPGGTSYDVSAVAPGSPTVESISTAIQTAVDALSIPNLTTSIDGTSKALVCTAAVTKAFVYENLPDIITIEDKSAATNYAADFALVTAETDAWYGVACDLSSAAAIAAISPVIETKRKIFVSDTPDVGVVDGASTTDAAYVAKAASRRNTYLQFTRKPGCAGALGLMCRELTQNPGSSSWAWKEIAAVAPDVLSTQDRADLKAKNCGYYVERSGLKATMWGNSSQGQPMSVTHGVHWLIAEIQKRVAALFAANEKIAFTDPGIESIGNEILAAMDKAATDDYKLLVPKSYGVTLPKASSFTTDQKLSKILSNIKFNGLLQGEIVALQLKGRLSV